MAESMAIFAAGFVAAHYVQWYVLDWRARGKRGWFEAPRAFLREVFAGR